MASFLSPKIFFTKNLRNWKLISLKKLLYLPHILNSSEKKFFMLAAAIFILSGGLLLSRSYLKLTKPVPETGGSHTEGMLKEPRNINPIYAATDTDRDIARLVFSRLIYYDSEEKIKTDLADRYEISEDGKTYTVFMRKNAFWHDEKPVTADDAVFTVKAVQNPQYKSPLRPNWQGVEAEKLDQYTVRFTLRNPYAPFIENLTLGIIPKHLWEAVNPEQMLLHEYNLKPVGSGPFQFQRFSRDKDGSILWYELQRNRRYYREGPYLQKITFVFFKNEPDMISSWHKGEIDSFSPLSAARTEEIDAEKNFSLNLRMPRIFGLFFNQNKAPALADKNVREAMARAVDKNLIAEKAASGGAAPADSPLPFLGSTLEESISHLYDPETAKDILEKSGWRDEDGDGVREKKITQKSKQTKLELKFKLTTSDWPDLLKSAELLKDMLENIGMEISIEKKSFLELESSVIHPRNFEMFLFGQVYGYEIDPFAFWHSSQIKDPGLNIAAYSNKKTDQLLEEARKISDRNLRNKKYTEFGKILTQDLPAIFLYSQLYSYIVPADLKGVELAKISLPADRFNEANEWYKKTKRVLK